MTKNRIFFLEKLSVSMWKAFVAQFLLEEQLFGISVQVMKEHSSSIEIVDESTESEAGGGNLASTEAGGGNLASTAIWSDGTLGLEFRRRDNSGRKFGAPFAAVEVVSGRSNVVLGQTDEHRAERTDQQRRAERRADGRQRTDHEEHRGGIFLKQKIPSDMDSYMLPDLGPFGLTLVTVSVGLLCFVLAYWYRSYILKLWQEVRAQRSCGSPDGQAITSTEDGPKGVRAGETNKEERGGSPSSSSSEEDEQAILISPRKQAPRSTPQVGGSQGRKHPQEEFGGRSSQNQQHSSGQSSSYQQQQQQPMTATEEEAQKQFARLVSPYVLCVVLVYSFVFTALLLNMKHMMTTLGFQQPLLISTMNVLGPLFMAFFLLQRSGSSPAADGDDETLRAQMRRSFGEGWMWCGAIVGVMGLVLVGGTVAMLRGVDVLV